MRVQVSARLVRGWCGKTEPARMEVRAPRLPCGPVPKRPGPAPGRGLGVGDP